VTWWLVGLAMAGGFTHRNTRQPLPARWVERPLVLPAGWTQVDVQVDADAVAGRGRLSLGPAAELRAAGRTDGTPPTVGAALALGRREAPARSASLDLDWTAPALGAPSPEHRIGLALPVRHQWGGSRWTAGPVADVGSIGFDTRIGLRGEAGLQAGPLGFTADATGWYAGSGGPRSTSWAGALGGFVQLNRALRVHGAARVGDHDGAFAGLELSL